MQLTLYTDYSLRVLLYLGQRPDERITITQISEYFDISRNHLVKVVHNLGKLKLIHTIRGKNGGMLLAQEPKDINLATVIQHIEPHMNLLECFDDETNTCRITNECKLKRILFKAKKSFLDAIKAYTLADLLEKNRSTTIQHVPANIQVIAVNE
ncbi:MAG: Rrf2 family transcriptional regulator [Mariprofundaceae bacterium]|nr:Rrf2 family transcriptional regulator [Mariprofundaceae bacterium]